MRNDHLKMLSDFVALKLYSRLLVLLSGIIFTVSMYATNIILISFLGGLLKLTFEKNLIYWLFSYSFSTREVLFAFLLSCIFLFFAIRTRIIRKIKKTAFRLNLEYVNNQKIKKQRKTNFFEEVAPYDAMVIMSYLTAAVIVTLVINPAYCYEALVDLLIFGPLLAFAIFLLHGLETIHCE